MDCLTSTHSVFNSNGIRGPLEESLQQALDESHRTLVSYMLLLTKHMQKVVRDSVHANKTAFYISMN